MPRKKSTNFNESTRPGTVSRVFAQYKKGECNESGEMPVYVAPKIIDKKNRLNSMY